MVNSTVKTKSGNLNCASFSDLINCLFFKKYYLIPISYITGQITNLETNRNKFCSALYFYFFAKSKKFEKV